MSRDRGYDIWDVALDDRDAAALKVATAAAVGGLAGRKALGKIAKRNKMAARVSGTVLGSMGAGGATGLSIKSKRDKNRK